MTTKRKAEPSGVDAFAIATLATIAEQLERLNDNLEALSLTQPWATLIAIGAKTIETRNWKTSYRGPIAIHAARSIDREICKTAPFADVLEFAGVDARSLPLGAIVAVTEIVDVKPTDFFLKYDGWAPFEQRQLDLAFGDFGPGRYGFVLHNTHYLPVPIGATGSLSVWNVPPAIERAVEFSLKVPSGKREEVTA
jgi:hypothetical protein